MTDDHASRFCQTTQQERVNPEEIGQKYRIWLGLVWHRSHDGIVFRLPHLPLAIGADHA